MTVRKMRAHYITGSTVLYLIVSHVNFNIM